MRATRRKVKENLTHRCHIEGKRSRLKQKITYLTSSYKWMVVQTIGSCEEPCQPTSSEKRKIKTIIERIVKLLVFMLHSDNFRFICVLKVCTHAYVFLCVYTRACLCFVCLLFIYVSVHVFFFYASVCAYTRVCICVKLLSLLKNLVLRLRTWYLFRTYYFLLLSLFLFAESIVKFDYLNCPVLDNQIKNTINHL